MEPAMKQVELRPLRDTPEEWDRIEKRIKELFRLEIYIPLLILGLGANKKTLHNSQGFLRDALLRGKVYFWMGKFTGTFNAGISKELKEMGAKWNKKTSSWDLRMSQLDPELRTAINISHHRFQQTARKIDKKLSDISPEEIVDKLKIEHIFDASLYKVEKDYQQSVKKITVPPKLTDSERIRISKEYTENVKINIRGWLKEEITTLRKNIEKHAFDGYRYETIVKDIQHSYGVSQKKAKFIARQETNLLLTKFKEARYQSAGIDNYKWRCVTGTPLHPVRPRHKWLNDQSLKGKIFKFSDPPISTDPDEPPRRNNPGEDYNCRCVAIPVVKFT